MSAYKQFLSKNLYDYIARNSSSDEDLSLREDLAIAKHTLGTTLKVYNNLHEKQLHELGLDERQRANALEITGKTIRQSLLEIAKLGKYIVEIEATLASKFNGVQVLSVIDQVVNILTQEYGHERAKQLSTRLEKELVIQGQQDGNYAINEDQFLTMLNSVPINAEGVTHIK